MKLSDYDFELPSHLIAQYPVSPRDSSKLLCIRGNNIADKKFSDIVDFIKDGDVLVFNDTKVIPAKLTGFITNSLMIKSKISLNLVKKMSDNTWSTFAKPARKLKLGSLIEFSQNLTAVVSEKKENGEVILTFSLEGNVLMQEINRLGSIPLPQYIRKGNSDDSDIINYQTVYAKNIGAVAAPTAGLHFTEELLQKIKLKGAKLAYVTLHVGGGTFLPVKTENIKDHKMHSELITLDTDNAKIINSAKRVICIGTTSMRALETIASDSGKVSEFSGDTQIFISSGYNFKKVDVLITNFHLPKSTLLILLCAFGGYQNIMKAYKHAIENSYRFFSYGDACWVEKG